MLSIELPMIIHGSYNAENLSHVEVELMQSSQKLLNLI